MAQQLDLFEAAKQPVRHNPFAMVQGVNMFGQRAIIYAFCACTSGDLFRPGYAGGEA